MGGRQFLGFMGGHSGYEGGPRAHGGIPPVPSTKENSAGCDLLLRPTFAKVKKRQRKS